MYYQLPLYRRPEAEALLEGYSIFDNLRPRKLIKIRHADEDFYKREAWGCRAADQFRVACRQMSTLLHPKNGRNPRRELYVSWKTERRA